METAHHVHPSTVADPLGLALKDYLRSPGQQEVLLMMANGAPPVTQRVSEFFAPNPVDEIEAAMLAACRGTVVDIGAGAGRSTLLLQHRGFDVLAIDISPGAVDVMTARGVRRVQCVDWTSFSETSEEMFDTMLMLGRGISLFGSPDRMGRLLRIAGRLVAPGGQIIADGREPPADAELTGTLTRLAGAIQCRGESDFRFRQREAWVRYGNVDGLRFQVLDVSFEALRDIAENAGWRVVLLRRHSDLYAVSFQRTW